ncbi:thioredoxin reductase GliT-like protein [Apiospora kogelbergensis]|uniref:thioredoxin reductase GliT-like protein n=1 Tax=Apiospora kogelbergensis TaxID=1337665 RepID=UPI00312F789A
MSPIYVSDSDLQELHNSRKSRNDGHPLVETSDVLILGAGPAGLSAAAGLARLLHTAVVFSTARFRNERARHMHAVPGWDHGDPAAFRAAARDVMPRISLGLRSCGATACNFHCLFCHGFEERGRPSAGLLATGPMAKPTMAPAVARMAGRLADRVTVYTNGDAEFGATMRELLKSTTKYRIEDRKIVSLAKDPVATPFATTTPSATMEQENAASSSAGHGLLVTLEDGTVTREAFLAHAPAAEQAGPFAAQLGLELEPQGSGGFIKVAAPFPATSVEGVFAAGDCATALRSVSAAMYMGATAAAGVVHSLEAEDDVGEEGGRSGRTTRRPEKEWDEGCADFHWELGVTGTVLGLLPWSLGLCRI